MIKKTNVAPFNCLSSSPIRIRFQGFFINSSFFQAWFLVERTTYFCQHVYDVGIGLAAADLQYSMVTEGVTLCLLMCDSCHNFYVMVVNCCPKWTSALSLLSFKDWCSFTCSFTNNHATKKNDHSHRGEHILGKLHVDCPPSMSRESILGIREQILVEVLHVWTSLTFWWISLSLHDRPQYCWV